MSQSKFSSGLEAFNQKHYFTATDMLRAELEKSTTKSDMFEKTYLIALSFRQMNLPDSAIVWLKKALDIADDMEAFYALAAEYKKTGQHRKAMEVLEESRRVFGNSLEIQKELAICRQAIFWMENPEQDINIEKLELNTVFSEFASDINGELIYFSSDQYLDTRDRYGWSGNYYYNIYTTDLSGNFVPRPLPGNVNTQFNESSASLTSDGNTMYFVRCGTTGEQVGNCYIYHAKKIADEWFETERLPFQINGHNYVSPRITGDGDILYYSSDVAGGAGGYDIYYVLKNEDQWSDPVRLPNTINTPGNENFVTLWKNEIYFSSDFHSGLGGLDIFSTSIGPDGKFSAPINVKPPLNSGGDDFNLLRQSDSTAIFNSSRIDGKGMDDIYAISVKSIKDSIVKDQQLVQTDTISVSKKLYLAVRIMENVYADPQDPNSRIVGRKAVSDANVRIGDSQISSTNANGFVIEQISFDTSFNVIVEKKDFLVKSQVVYTENESFYPDEINTINVRIIIERVYLDTEIVIRNIYYDFDRWDLRSESEGDLNLMYEILKNNPKFNVIIGSHTDCRGDEEYNLELSQKRAQSVVDYLVNKGLESERIIATGYGKTKLLDNCVCEDCSEEQHQNNRRTTFELTEK